LASGDTSVCILGQRNRFPWATEPCKNKASLNMASVYTRTLNGVCVWVRETEASRLKQEGFRFVCIGLSV
jgi:hypothetical protein